MKRWKGRIRGAVCGYEFTLTPAGWHYHAHILAFREAWYDQAEIFEGSEEIRSVHVAEAVGYRSLDRTYWT